jgi:predicted anti-sigma-YlaC factor YlaD
LGTAQQYTPPADSAEALQRIERNTAEIARWAKILFAAVVVLIIVTIVLYI